MLRHDFTSPEDTSDRLYVTSASIVRDTSTMFASWLDRVNALIGARNFPVHVEVRVSDGHVSPIEFNPLRFAGLGGTDVSWYGYGSVSYTHLRPLTDHTPKALVSVAGKPMLERVILRLKEAGFNDITVNIHHFGEQIIKFLRANNDFGITIHLSDERDMLLDTGGGIKKARPFLDDNEPFLVHLSLIHILAFCGT